MKWLNVSQPPNEIRYTRFFLILSLILLSSCVNEIKLNEVNSSDGLMWLTFICSRYSQVIWSVECTEFMLIENLHVFFVFHSSRIIHLAPTDFLIFLSFTPPYKSSCFSETIWNLFANLAALFHMLIINIGTKLMQPDSIDFFSIIQSHHMTVGFRTDWFSYEVKSWDQDLLWCACARYTEHSVRKLTAVKMRARASW